MACVSTKVWDRTSGKFRCSFDRASRAATRGRMQSEGRTHVARSHAEYAKESFGWARFRSLFRRSSPLRYYSSKHYTRGELATAHIDRSARRAHDCTGPVMWSYGCTEGGFHPAERCMAKLTSPTQHFVCNGEHCGQQVNPPRAQSAT